MTLTPQPSRYIDSPKASTVVTCDEVPIPLTVRKEIPKEIPMSGTLKPSSAIDRLRPVVSGAKFPVIVAGSGVSNASFMRQSRGTAYSARDHAEQVSAKDLGDVLGVWQRFLGYRRGAGKIDPNATHMAIGNFINDHPSGIVLDLNTDGLLQRAMGVDRLFQLRGSIWRNRCRKCGFTYTDTHCDAYDPKDREAYYAPKCRKCEMCMHPDVLLRDEPMQGNFKNLSEYGAGLLLSADVIVLVGITPQECSAPLFEKLRPQMKRNTGGGFGGKPYLIEIATEKAQFVGDSLLVGKLEHLTTQLFASQPKPSETT